MKPLTICLISVFLLLQYRILFATDGVSGVLRQKKEIALQTQENAALQRHNHAIMANIAALKQGGVTIESIARTELGMIKQGEKFYQVVN